LPTVTFHGPKWYQILKDGSEIYRGETREVSQAWVDEYRYYLNKNPCISVKGDAGVTVDEGDDGIPDAGWTKKDISAWLKAKGAEFGGYATKAKLLGLVEDTLNPPAPEPEPEPVVQEAAVEETIIEDPVDESSGDE